MWGGLFSTPEGLEATQCEATECEAWSGGTCLSHQHQEAVQTDVCEEVSLFYIESLRPAKAP